MRSCSTPANAAAPDDDLALRLEAISRLDDDEKAAVFALIESMLLRHEARRLTAPCAATQ